MSAPINRRDVEPRFAAIGRTCLLLCLLWSMPALADPVRTPDAGAAPELRRFWLEEDTAFPRRQAVAPYVRGVPDGEARFYVASGALCMVDHYKAGVIDGERVEYYPGGARFLTCPFVDGRANGFLLQWYPDGTLFSKMEFREGAQTGGFTQYFKNGRPAMECQVIDGLVQGQRRHYLPDGRLFGITEWVDGQETGRRSFLLPTQSDYAAIADLVNWAGLRLKQLWAE